MNPLDDHGLPFGLPRFADIEPTHFLEAIPAAMAEEEAEIAAILADPSPPGFATVLIPLDRSGARLRRLTGILELLATTCACERLDAIRAQLAPAIALHRLRIASDPALFATLDALFQARHTLGLALDELRLMARFHREAVAAGAGLDERDRTRLREITDRCAELQLLFQHNLLHAEAHWELRLEPAVAAAMPPELRAATAQAANARGRGGEHLVTLSRSLVERILRLAPDRSLRETVFRAWTARGAQHGPHDNRGLIAELLALRAESARLCGHSSFAHAKLADAMIGTPTRAEAMLIDLWDQTRPCAAAEIEALQRNAQIRGGPAELAPWDWRYYAGPAGLTGTHAQARPQAVTFPLAAVRDAAFEAAGRLFGLHFDAVETTPLHHGDARAFLVRDRRSAPIALFVQDLCARPGKQSGAWMDRIEPGPNGLPIILNICNFVPGDPTMLSVADGRTLFHELGHALHALLGQTRYRAQSGTAVARDFVEFPSQLFENWFRAGATPVPAPDAALEFLEYLASAIIDLRLHRADTVGDATAMVRGILADIGMPAYAAPRHSPPHFSHIFGNEAYAASYYAYVHAEALEADFFTRFDEAGDLFDPAAAASLADMLAAGDSIDPITLFREAVGREPDSSALLQRRLRGKRAA